MMSFNHSALYQDINLSKIKKQFPTLDKKIKSLETIQNHQYQHKQIATLALLHGSALVHWPSDKSGVSSNEKLEYLGDSFLNYFVAAFSMSLLPHLSEGEYSKLRAQIVGESSLAAKARLIGLGNCLLLGKSHQNNSAAQQESILADAFEAITAALLLDASADAVFNWLSSLFKEDIIHFSTQLSDIDVKGAVQNWTQRYKGVVPNYVATDITSNISQPQFEVGLYVAEFLVATATASNKKEASLKAAEKAWALIKSGEFK